VGMVCAVAVAAVSFGGTLSPPEGRRSAKHRLGDDGSSRDCRFCHHAIAGATDSKTDPTTVDLKSQLRGYAKAISMQATVYEDEFGGLASSFNETRVISRTTLAAQRKASGGASQEELQRQVIRLLDDVEEEGREI